MAPPQGYGLKINREKAEQKFPEHFWFWGLNLKLSPSVSKFLNAHCPGARGERVGQIREKSKFDPRNRGYDSSPCAKIQFHNRNISITNEKILNPWNFEETNCRVIERRNCIQMSHLWKSDSISKVDFRIHRIPHLLLTCRIKLVKAPCCNGRKRQFRFSLSFLLTYTHTVPFHYFLAMIKSACLTLFGEWLIQRHLEINFSRFNENSNKGWDIFLRKYWTSWPKFQTFLFY